MTTGTSAYVHFPWCLKKCPYCDFATRKIDREDVPHAAYADAVLWELDQRAAALTQRRLTSVFFGGGTPSLWDPRELGRVLRAVRGAFGSEVPELEVTVECNPSSLDRKRALALREEGVNRLSIGVQSLDDDRLRFLGRFHDAAGALRSLDDAMAVMPRVSVDLMFGMPGQSTESFVLELQRLLDRGVRHVSAYALTLEPGTQFGELHRKGRLALAPDEMFAEAFLRAEALCEIYELEHYEVSNYAVPGEQSRHNLHYWQAKPYLGLGAGAVGCLDESQGSARRYRNEPNGLAYIKRALGPRIQIQLSEERLRAEELVREALMLGLRTRKGVDLAETRQRTGLEPLAQRARAVQRRIAAGDLIGEGERLRVPPRRWLHLDAIILDLF